MLGSQQERPWQAIMLGDIALVDSGNDGNGNVLLSITAGGGGNFRFLVRYVNM